MAKPQYQMIITISSAKIECDSSLPTAVAMSGSPAAIELDSCSPSRATALGPAAMLEYPIPTVEPP